MKKYLLTLLVITAGAVWCNAQGPVLWGLTSYGGANSTTGTIFKITAAGNFTGEYSFNPDTDGIGPTGSLIKANDGLLYGLAPHSQPEDGGALFSYNIGTGKETVLHYFNDDDGETPYGSLIQASNSLLYGLTYEEANGDAGSIFSYDISSGTVTNLHSFEDNKDGIAPMGSLLQVNDTMLYGMTTIGSTNGSDAGIIFSFNIKSNEYTALYNFANNEDDGGLPVGSLILGKNGLLYGLTTEGGLYNSGVIFYYDISTNTDWDMWDFGSSDTDGITPKGSLLQLNDSLMYGTTSSGGTSNGIIFSFNINSNREKILHKFTGNTDGQFPQGSLILASDGLLYGTTAGGDDDDGTVFSYNVSTGITTDIFDFNGANGSSPDGDLLEDDATGVNQLSVSTDELSVYPNPTTGQFAVYTTGNQNGKSVEVYNVMGEMVYQSTLAGSPYSINLASQPCGLYFVNLKTDKGIEVGKVTVDR